MYRIRELIFFLPALLFIVVPIVIRLMRRARKKRDQENTDTIVPETIVSEILTPPSEATGEPSGEQSKTVQIKNASIFPPVQPRWNLPARPSTVPSRTVEELDSPGLQQKGGPIQRLESLSPLRRAVLWAEILGPSRGRTDDAPRDW